eukprot:scaffold297840_cov38-Prasinocladus_malaysianus.AAC.1
MIRTGMQPVAQWRPNSDIPANYVGEKCHCRIHTVCKTVIRARQNSPSNATMKLHYKRRPHVKGKQGCKGIGISGVRHGDHWLRSLR